MAGRERMMKVDEVMERLGVSKATAYQVIKRLNAELEAKGLRTIPGRVSERYFDETYFSLKGAGEDDIKAGGERHMDEPVPLRGRLRPLPQQVQARVRDRGRCRSVREALQGQGEQVARHQLPRLHRAVRGRRRPAAEGEHLADQGVHHQRQARPLLRADDNDRGHDARRGQVAERPPEGQPQDGTAVHGHLPAHGQQPGGLHLQPRRAVLQAKA